MLTGAVGSIGRAVSPGSRAAGHPHGRQTRPGDAPRPANLYGATKAWDDAMGAWAAASSSTSVAALRIGFFAASPPVGVRATTRDLAP